MGGCSNAPMNHKAQNRSSVFDVDPQCHGGRIGGDDDDVVASSYNKDMI